ncbi:hypothetical protein ACFXTO_007295 [Malus domestica]
MGQHLLAQTRQVESLMAEVVSLRQEIKGHKHENVELHMLANNYLTGMKRKLNQLQESESHIQSDHERFVALFRMNLLSPSPGVLPSVEFSNDQPLVPPPSEFPPNIEASYEQSPMSPPSGVQPSTKASHEQPL